MQFLQDRAADSIKTPEQRTLLDYFVDCSTPSDMQDRINALHANVKKLRDADATRETPAQHALRLRRKLEAVKRRLRELQERETELVKESSSDRRKTHILRELIDAGTTVTNAIQLARGQLPHNIQNAMTPSFESELRDLQLNGCEGAGIVLLRRAIAELASAVHDDAVSEPMGNTRQLLASFHMEHLLRASNQIAMSDLSVIKAYLTAFDKRQLGHLLYQRYRERFTTEPIDLQSLAIRLAEIASLQTRNLVFDAQLQELLTLFNNRDDLSEELKQQQQTILQQRAEHCRLIAMSDDLFAKMSNFLNEMLPAAMNSTLAIISDATETIKSVTADLQHRIDMLPQWNCRIEGRSAMRDYQTGLDVVNEQLLTRPADRLNRILDIVQQYQGMRKAQEQEKLSLLAHSLLNVTLTHDSDDLALWQQTLRELVDENVAGLNQSLSTFEELDAAVSKFNELALKDRPVLFSRQFCRRMAKELLPK